MSFSSMLRILEDLNKTMVKYSYMRQMWKTYSISQWLASSQRMVNELRMNMLVGGLALSISIFLTSC